MSKLDFGELVENYYQALFRYGMSLSRNVEEASDLVQQTFLLWAEKGHQLRDLTKVKSWLYTTLYREFLRNRRRGNRFSNDELPEAVEDFGATGKNPGRIVDGNIALEALYELDEVFRAPLTLFYLEDMAYKDIAEILDIPIGTVMSRISRAKAQLKEKLEKKNLLKGHTIQFPEKGGVIQNG
jgi:RNA polymerase sigma-70 factor (ECF subfamily)